MYVRIGVIYTSKEIEIELGDKTESEKVAVQQEINSVLSERSDKPAVLWLTDKRGRTIGVPTEKIAYVEIDGDSSERRVGFVG